MNTYSNTEYYSQATACRTECDAATCTGAAYHTFAVPLADLGQTCGSVSIQFAGATASSGLGTVSSDRSVQDIGGAGDDSCPELDVHCSCCVECEDSTSPFYCGGDTDICLRACVSSCVADETFVPVELLGFFVE